MPAAAPVTAPSGTAKTVTRVVKFCVDTRGLSDHQTELFERHAGTHRAVWNWALAQRNDHEKAIRRHVRDQAAAASDGTHDGIVAVMGDAKWRKAAFALARKENPTPFSYTATGFDKEFTRLARSGEVYGYTRNGDPRSFGWWVGEDHGVSRNAVNQPLRLLDSAVSRYYAGQAKRGTKKRKDGMPSGWPTFKSKHDAGQFAILNLSTGKQGASSILSGSSSGHSLKIPSLGIIRVHNNLRRLRRMIAKGGVPKSARFTQVADRWYVAINVSFAADNPYIAPRNPSRRQHANGAVGVDLGVALLAATSDRETFDRLKPAREAHDKMSKAQRVVSRGVKGSNRNRKAKARVARLHHRTALKRATAQHHLTKYLTTSYESVIIEDLNLSSMTKRATPRPDPERPGRFAKNGARAKSGLNRSLLDVGMAEIARQLDYKSEWYGSSVHKVNPAYTSRECSRCGHIDAKNRETQADFLCVKCGHGDNADVNAAINIRNRHLGLPGAGAADAARSGMDLHVAHAETVEGRPGQLGRGAAVQREGVRDNSRQRVRETGTPFLDSA